MTTTQLRGGKTQEAAAQSPACGIAATDVSMAASAMPARGAALARLLGWCAPQIDEIATTHAQGRRMARAACEVFVPVYDDQHELIAQLRVSKQEVLRGLRWAERKMRPPIRMRLTITGGLAGVLWVTA